MEAAPCKLLGFKQPVVHLTLFSCFTDSDICIEARTEFFIFIFLIIFFFTPSQALHTHCLPGKEDSLS